MCVVLTKRGNALEWCINHYIFILYDADFYTVLYECINYIINIAFNNNNHNKNSFISKLLFFLYGKLYIYTR